MLARNYACQCSISPLAIEVDDCHAIVMVVGSQAFLTLQEFMTARGGFIKASESAGEQKQVDTPAGGAVMKGAGTTDMLAWLDAKIAAQKAALIN